MTFLGRKLLVWGELPPQRAQAVADAIADFNRELSRGAGAAYRPHSLAVFQRIPAVLSTAQLLPAPVMSIGGNQDDLYVELENGMRLVPGSVLPSGYRIYAISRFSLALVRNQTLIALPLNL
jgi:type III secretion protein D